MSVGEIELFSGPSVGVPLNMTVDTEDRFWWADVGLKALGCFEPLSKEPGETERSVSLGENAMPIQPRLGSDGNIWFTDAGRGGLGRIDLGGEDLLESDFIPLEGAPPLLGLSPPDASGRHWFTSREAGLVGSFDPTAQDPARSIRLIEDSRFDGLTGAFPGPDGHIWIANVGADQICRLDPTSDDPASSLEFYPESPGGIHPRAWRPGPDGGMWFSQREPDQLLRIEPGVDWQSSIEVIVGSELVSEPDGLCEGADGRLWFANAGGPSIGALDPKAEDPASTLEFFSHPDLGVPFDLQAVGPFMAFTDKSGKVGRIRVV
jgi:streptogramin lyase